MRMVETHGAPKISMNSAERDYKQRLRQAIAQGDGNPFVMGIQSVYEKGAASKEVSPYGDQPVKPQEILDQPSNFQSKNSPANAPLEMVLKQTGSADLGTSSTNSPSDHPEDLHTDALEQRLAMYAKAGSNAGFGNNNRAQTTGLV